MELIDFYSYEADARKTCASLINRCDNYMLSHKNTRLWLEVTDHRFDTIRLYSENVPLKDVELLESFCPRCGSNLFPSNKNYCRSLADYALSFCYYCQSLIGGLYGCEQLQLLLAYLGKIDFKDKKETIMPNSIMRENQVQAQKQRIRVLTDQRTMLYLTLERIRMDENNELYIFHEEGDKSDKVLYAGVYLHFRDINGVRLYEGDIVKGKFRISNEEDFRSFVCVARPSQSEYYPFQLEGSPLGDFPPAPNWIDYKSIEIIGNLWESPGLINNSDGYINNIIKPYKQIVDSIRNVNNNTPISQL